MKIMDAGHSYLVDCIDGKDQQSIRFVKREGDGFPFNSGHYSGTNCQELLRVLIDRTEYLNRQKPCMETEAAAGCLRAALALYELRAARRHDRYLELESTQGLMNASVCLVCHHVGCGGECRGEQLPK